MFDVEYDPSLDALWIRVHGFWKAEDVPALGKAIAATVVEAAAVSPRFDVIVESLDFPVQSNDVADLLTGVMRANAPLTSGHFAVVVGSHLNKLQAERTLAHPRLKVFMKLEDAGAWLAAMRSSEADAAE